MWIRSGNTTATILLAFALAAVVAGCRGEADDGGEANADRPPCKVRSQAVQIDRTPEAVTLTGVTEPIRRAMPSARLMAKVVEAGFKEGDRVEAGRLLVRLDTSDLEARRRQALAGLDAARTGLDIDRTNRTRMRGLVDAGAGPRAQLDPAEIAFAQATAAVATVNAGLDELATNLSYAKVQAPFAGVIVQRMTEVGNLVGPGQPLLIIEDDSRLRIVASVGADLATVLSPTQTLRVTVGGKTTEATVESIVSSGDARAPGLRVQLVVANPGHRFRTGVLAVVEVPTASQESSAVAVPRASLIARGQLVGVFVVAADSTARLRWLVTGDARDDTVRVLTGLHAGDRVVLSPDISCLADGRLVTEEGR